MRRIFGCRIYRPSKDQISFYAARLPIDLGIPVEDLWKIYRDYVEHEDKLIGERLQRMLFIQGFLFAAAAALVSQSIGNASSFYGLEVFRRSKLDLFTYCQHLFLNANFAECLLTLVVSFIGAMAANAVKGALKAAIMAHVLLQEGWDRVADRKAAILGLPGLRGAGSAGVHRQGQEHILVLPTCFLVIWSAAFGVILILLVWTAWSKF